MCRKRLRASWLIFLGLICILGSAHAYLTADSYDEDEDMYDDVGAYAKKRIQHQHQEQETEDEDGSETVDRRWHGIGKREPAFTPYISVGALSNMQQFFENLKGNLDSLENLPMGDRAALMGKSDHAAESEARAFRPPATAAYLHAIRNQRPAHKIRNFVANSEPMTLRGSNYYDPSYLWSGLGRKRRR